MFKFLLISALLLIANTIYGQEEGGKVQVQRSSIVSPGAYIRITAPTMAIGWTARGNPIPIKGIVKTTHADTIVLNVEDVSDPMHIPFGAIKKLEVPGGSTRINNAFWGAGIGFFCGALIGGSCGKMVSFAILGIPGLFAGGLIGYCLPPGRGWTEVPLRTIKIGLSPRQDNGFGLEVSFTF